MNLNEIDDNFTETRLKLEKLIEKYDFVPQFEFVLNEYIDYSLLDSIDFPGIYKIEIKTRYEDSDFNQWSNKFREEWEKAEYKDKFVPNIKKKRLNAHNNLTEWIPIYIGKSRKIKNRIKEHIDLRLTRPTTALKLLERINLFGKVFRISTISVSVKNYDLIVSEFENYFREKVNPILGRK